MIKTSKPNRASEMETPRTDASNSSKTRSGHPGSPQTWTSSSDPAVQAVAGPDGMLITRDDLPPNDTDRWVIRRKAIVVAAVRGGLLSLPDACEKWNISEEEYHSWEHLIDRHGVRGLRATRLQHYRDRDQKNAS